MLKFKRLHVSDIWKLNIKGHANFEFVDVVVNDDTKLFIDPILLLQSDRSVCKRAAKRIESFFVEFYRVYRDENVNDERKTNLLSHAGEQNATKLGYGNGFNGKGNTADGLIDVFEPLELLVKKIPTMSRPEDLKVFVPNFAEDGLSDLLTNIIHDELATFTAQMAERYSISSENKKLIEYWYWDDGLKKWVSKERMSYLYDGEELLLVPKEIVRKNYLFSAGQFLRSVIISHMVQERTDSEGNHPTKGDMEKELRDSYHNLENWLYKIVCKETEKNNGFLDEYHRGFLENYSRAKMRSDKKQSLDEMLDSVVYEAK